METQDAVDDFVVRFDDGSKHFFQAKLSLQRHSSVWTGLWEDLYAQLRGLSPDDRLVLMLGEPTALSSDLTELSTRSNSLDAAEWLSRATAKQREITSSIADVLSEPAEAVLRLFKRLEVCVWPGRDLARDLAPLWMPASNVSAAQMLEILAGCAWAGSETRQRFEGATLRERLRLEWSVRLSDAPSWGLARYRDMVAEIAVIEVPGTVFRQRREAEFVWPRCLRYDRDRRPDFDDDFRGWREFDAVDGIDLSHFPGAGIRAAVLVAGPGFGKSTVVNAIAARVARDGLIPVVIPATEFSDSNCSIGDYLEKRVNQAFDVKIDWRAAATTGSLVVLLDGLDEISSDKRTLVLERFKVYRAACPDVPWLMTVRDPAVLAPPDGAAMLELAPLSQEDIRTYAKFYRPDEPSIGEVLLRRVSARADLAQLTRIPIFLSLMLVLRLENSDLRRSQLLESYIETLFRPSEFKKIERESVDVATLRRIAERAAYEALEGDSIGLTKQIFERSVVSVAPQTSVDDAREALIRRGLLRKTGLATLSFPFPIVQEYLASAELLKQSVDEIFRRLSLIFRRPWAQAIQFALEQHQSPDLLVARLLDGPDDVFHTALRLLGRCVANGMSISPDSRDELGERFAAIWGSGPWRTRELVDGIIIDAFSNPIHPAIRERLGDRWLIHHGSGTIVALNRDKRLTLSVLSSLLDGDLEHLFHLDDLQAELDRSSGEVLELYLARCRRGDLAEKDADAISCLIGHLDCRNIDESQPYLAAIDVGLPLQVRLVAWEKTSRELDEATEELIITAMREDGYRAKSAAAKALAHSRICTSEAVRILNSGGNDAEGRADFVNYLICEWRRNGLQHRIQELLSIAELDGICRDIAILYAISDGDYSLFNDFFGRMKSIHPRVASMALMLLGHVEGREVVELAVSAVSAREWSAKETVDISGAFATGLTYRMNMMGLGTGSLEPRSLHSGRSLPLEMMSKWLKREDHSPLNRLRISLDCVQLGMPMARAALSSNLRAALNDGAGSESMSAISAARALEALHRAGEGLPLDELEQLAKESSYNLADCALGLIAANGSRNDATTLVNLYCQVSPELKSVILGYLEPLASRHSLKVTKDAGKLVASAI
jgi:hypothetical protein